MMIQIKHYQALAKIVKVVNIKLFNVLLELFIIEDGVDVVVDTKIISYIDVVVACASHLSVTILIAMKNVTV